MATKSRSSKSKRPAGKREPKQPIKEYLSQQVSQGVAENTSPNPPSHRANPPRPCESREELENEILEICEASACGLGTIAKALGRVLLLRGLDRGLELSRERAAFLWLVIDEIEGLPDQRDRKDSAEIARYNRRLSEFPSQISDLKYLDDLLSADRAIGAMFRTQSQPDATSAISAMLIKALQGNSAGVANA